MEKFIGRVQNPATCDTYYCHGSGTAFQVTALCMWEKGTLTIRK